MTRRPRARTTRASVTPAAVPWRPCRRSSTSPCPTTGSRRSATARSPMSTRDVTLAEEGFVHCSFADQVAATGRPLLRRSRRGRGAAHRPRRSSPARSSSRTSYGSGDRLPARLRTDRRRRPSAEVRTDVTPTTSERSAPVRLRERSSSSSSSGSSLLGGRRRATAAAAVAGLLLRPLLLLQGRLLGDEALEAGEAGGVEAAVGDRRPHRAARLLVVLAVPEAALVHEVEDVGERPLDALTGQPQAQGADTRGVDQPPLAGQRQQLGGDGRVPTALVAARGPRWWPARRSRAGR